MEFTKEENFNLELTNIICKWSSEELDAEKAMELIEDLDITRLTESPQLAGAKK